MPARKKEKPAAKPALPPDALIAASRRNRIRLVEKRPPRKHASRALTPESRDDG